MNIRVGRARGIGLVLGFGLDRLFGDPERGHPVAGFGRVAAAVERRTYADSTVAGAAHVALLVGAVALTGGAVARCARSAGPVAESAVTAAAVWACAGGTSLSRTGVRMADHLASDDLSGARDLLPSLCGRDPAVLDETGLARAALESVAENTSDATVGVMFWGAVAGIPGVLGYRAINTLDAMVGYRSPKYSKFGWCAARLDDVVNLVPARLTGLLTVGLAPVVGGRPALAARAWRDDASRHPSPNAGVAEATAAGALGVSLGGRTEYAHGVEIRPTLGHGPAPGPADLRRAARLSVLVQAAATTVSAALAVAVGQARVHRSLRL